LFSLTDTNKVCSPLTNTNFNWSKVKSPPLTLIEAFKYSFTSSQTLYMLLGGNGIVNNETFSQVEAWARLQGATKVNAWAQEAQARLYKLKANFNTVRMVVEKDL